MRRSISDNIQTTSALFIISIILGLFQPCNAQDVNDSLFNELRAASGTERVDILNQISKSYEHTHPDSSFQFVALPLLGQH